MLIFICDDSRADQLRLVKNINSYAREIHASVTVQLFDSADAMLSDFRSRPDKPEIIFLDIYMDGTNGMDTAHALVESGVENGLVFTTSSEEHALQAFSIGADGYLHKPFTHEEFIRAMRRFRQLFADSSRYITAQFNREETRVYLSGIYFAESAGHSTVFFTDKGQVRSSAPLNSFLPEFEDQPGFLVCGRSYIVNLDTVESYDQDSGEMKFPDGSSLSVPVRMRREVRLKLRDKEV